MNTTTKSYIDIFLYLNNIKCFISRTTTTLQKFLGTSESRDSNETSLTNISSPMPVTPSLNDQQMTSISDQENDFTVSVSIPPSPSNLFLLVKKKN